MASYQNGTWNRQVELAYVRALIDVHRATPPGEEADDLAAEIRREIERLRGIDLDAAEQELEFLDPHAHPADWPAWTDADCGELNSPAGGDGLGLADPADADEDVPLDPTRGFAPPADEADGTGRLTLAEWVAAQAALYRRLGTAAGALLAETIADLAAAVRVTHARTPEQARDRLAVLAAR